MNTDNSSPIQALLLLPKAKLKAVMKEFLDKASKSQVRTVVKVVDHVVYRHRYHRAAVWIENRLRKNPNLEPRTVAYSYLQAVGGNKRMFPWLLTIARRAKDRLRKKRALKTD